MEQGWVLTCLANELLIEGNCVPIAKIEQEIRHLLGKGRHRTHEDNIRLAIIYGAMKDYLAGLEDVERQLQRSKSYLTQMYDYFFSSSSDSSSSKTGGALVQTTRRRRRPARRSRQSYRSYRR